MFDFWAVNVVLLLALTATVVMDLRERRIPEWITHPLTLAGFALAWHAGGWGEPGAPPSLSSSLVAFAVVREFFALFDWLYSFIRPEHEAMGEGDINLLGAVAAVMGWPLSVGCGVFIIVAGGIQAVAAGLARTPPGRSLCARLGMSETADPDFARFVPFGLSIAAGTAAFRVWQVVH